MKKKVFARVLSIMISAILIVGMIPFTYVSAASGDDNIVNSLDSFNNPSGSVDDYSTSANPYGYGNGQVFTMSAQSELYHFYSYNLNKGDGDYRNNYFYHNFQPGTIKDGIASAKMSGITPEEGVAPYERKSALLSSSDESYILYHMQAVAFDPFNSGRDDHIAYIGIDKDGNIRVYVMDANSGKVSNLFRVGLEGAAKHLVGNKMQAYEASNYIAITAGRYVAYDESKPQQGETLVVYAPDHKIVPSLRELTVSKEGGNLVVSQIGSGSSYLQYDYRVGTYGERMQQEGDVNDSLVVSLATGDFDGDRIDDLAVLSSVSDVDGAYQTVSYQYFMPELYVVFGGGSGTILNRSASKKEIGIWNDDQTEMRTFTSPDVTAGDLDGDGVDDIITAGWQLVVKKDSNKSSINGYQLAEGVTVAAYSGLKKTATQMILTHFDDSDDKGKSGNIVNHWSKFMQDTGIAKANFLTQVFVMPKYVVEAVAINGGSAADMIFMNGTFCKFDSSEGLAYVHTPSYFQHPDSAVEGTDVNVNYISSTAVAVFDDNTVGREQITVSIGLKESGQDDYWFLMGTMGGYDYNDTVKGGEVTQYGYTESIYSTAFDRKAFDTSEYDYHDRDDYPVENKGNGEKQFLNHLVVAVDIEQDGIVAKYETKKLIYSDPNLVSVLQAAPYFGELPGTEGSTSYEIGVEYTIGEQSSQSTSFSIGISAEVEGPGIKTSFGAGYNTSWSKSFEESVTESYSTTFEAGEENVVVLQRTPIVVYRYKVMDNTTGEWKGEIQVSIPAEPIYVLLPVAEYNAFADDFNAKLKAADKDYTGNRLNKIDSNLENAGSLINNEGDPDMYIKTWAGIAGAKSLSGNSPYGVTTATGSITSSYSSSSSETEGSEHTQGFYVNASLGTGASFLVGSAYVGVETSVEGDWTVGSYTTTTSYSSVSGTVSNLGNANGNIPANILSQYGFSWTFGTWNIELDNDNPKIPVYGFQVSGVTRPTNSPQNLKADHGSTETEVVLNWDAVPKATGYIIYSYDIAGTRNEIGRIAPASGTPTTTFTYTIDNSIPFYTFAVSAITGADTEGAMSSKVFYYPQSSGLDGQDGITPQLQINATTNEWEVSYDGGLTWISLGVKATGEDGADGADGQDGTDGTDGVDGVDGITPQVRINPETNIWEISYDEGVTWISLGVAATGADGQDGNDGDDGITPQLRINATTNEWEVSYDNGTTWSPLGVKATGADGADGQDGSDGTDGNDGDDGITPQLRINSTTNEWEVSYDNGTTWSPLGVKATGADGADGQDGSDGTDGNDGDDGITPQLRINSNTNEWEVSYDNGTTWSPLGVKATGADGADGADGQDGANGTDGNDGNDGITPQLRINSTTNEWEVSYDNGTTWSSLGIKAIGADGTDGQDGNDGKDGRNGADGRDGRNGKNGTDGKDGREIELRIDGGYIQWHYVGEAEWQNLISLDTFKGDKGDDGADGRDGIDGTNGSDGKDGENGMTPHIGENGNWWIGDTDTGVSATGKDGEDGVDGVTIAAIALGSLAMLGNLGWGVFFISKKKKGF